MRILELTNFSAGGCGVFARVIEESKLLAKNGHQVMIFSSNRVKGSDRLAKNKEAIGGVRIKRFPAIKLGGESFMYWFGKSAVKETLRFKPEAIIVHAYRHPHTTQALKLKKYLRCKVFLVTHAPFARSRSVMLNFFVRLYDIIIAKRIINQFDKVITITKWEVPYLTALGVNNNQMIYLPNGVRAQFFRNKNFKELNKIIYTGRISPIKQIETLLLALQNIKDKKIRVGILGPAEADYLTKLKRIIKDKGIENRILINDKTYSIEEQIKKLDEAKIFVLPSKTEGMPQVLVEAMARGKIVVASDNLASRDLIINGKNGFIYGNNNPKALADKINLILKMKEEDLKEIRKKARKSVEQFSWNTIINKIEKLIKA